MEPLESFEEAFHGLCGMYIDSIEHLLYKDKIGKLRALSLRIKEIANELDEEIEQEELKHKQLINV